MSWSVSTPAVSADQLIEAVDAVELPVMQANYEESLEQLTAAKAAAKAIFSSGCIGTTGFYSVTMVGHSVTGHAVPPGYPSSGEFVTVSVYTRTQPQEETNG